MFPPVFDPLSWDQPFGLLEIDLGAERPTNLADALSCHQGEPESEPRSRRHPGTIEDPIQNFRISASDKARLLVSSLTLGVMPLAGFGLVA